MNTPKHILVIRLSALGDVAMAVPVLRLAAMHYPDLKFTVVSRKQYRALFDEIDNVEFLEADVYGRHKGLGLFRLASEAKALGIDAAADLHNVIRSKLLRTVLRLSGKSIAVIDKGRNEKQALTRSDSKVFQPLRSTHERYADVFRQLGLQFDLTDKGCLPQQDVSLRLHQFIGNHTHKAIGIAPFAAYRSKMYPLESMQQLIAELDELGTYRIFLFGGGKKEEDLLADWEHQYSHVRNVAGQLTFTEELSLISNLDLMLSMDSSNGHLAAMFGVPVVTLWGVTHPYAGFQPYLQPLSNSITVDIEKYPKVPTSVYGNKFPPEYENIMSSIPVIEVLDKIQDLMS